MVFNEPLGETNTERNVKISAGISQESTEVMICLLSNSNIYEFKFNRIKLRFSKKLKLTPVARVRALLKSSNIWGLQIQRGENFGPIKMLASAITFVFLTFLG